MRSWLLLLVGCIPWFAYSSVTVTRTEATVAYEFKIENFKLEEETTDGKSFQKILLQGVDGYTGLYHKKGEPELPVVRFYVLGNGEIEVERAATTSDTSYLKIPRFVRASDSVVKVKGAKKRLPPFKELSVDSNTSFTVEDVGTYRGVRQRLVTLYPVNWNSTSGVVKKYSRFKVTTTKVESPRLSEASLLVFVVAERFHDSEALEKLIEHKRKLGFLIKKVEITKEEKTAKTIRNELMQVYEENPETMKYVVLVGSARLMPGHHTARIKGITDHYYRCLDQEDYEADLGSPDVQVGRLSVRSEEELDVVVEKIIKYETNAFNNTEWLKKVSLISTNDKEQWKLSEENNTHLIERFLKPKGYTGSFPEKNISGGDRLFAETHKASGKDVLRSINEGRAFIQYSGHGISSAWDYPRVTVSDLAKLQDTQALPVVISNACETAKITAPNSFAETWLRNRNGAIFFWGAMDVAYWDEDYVLQKKLAEEVFGNGNLEIGSFTSSALADVWRHWGGEGESKFYWEVYMSLGDPSIKARLK